MGTIHRMAGQEQLQSGAGQPQCLCPFGIDHHAFGYRRGTGCNWVILTFYLHKTETASSKGLALFPNGAKVGDVDVIIQSCPQDVFAWGSSYSLTINRQRNAFSFYQYPPPCSLPEGEEVFGQKLPFQPGISPFRRAPVPYRSSYQHLPF